MISLLVPWNLLKDCVPPTDVSWLNALGAHTAFKIGAFFATHHRAFGVTVGHLAMQAHEIEDQEMELQCDLNISQARVEELEHELKAQGLIGRPTWK